MKKSAWFKYCSSDVFNIDEKEAEEFDKIFPPRAKEYRHTQEEFRIACRAFIA